MFARAIRFGAWRARLIARRFAVLRLRVARFFPTPVILFAIMILNYVITDSEVIISTITLLIYGFSSNKSILSKSKSESFCASLLEDDIDTMLASNSIRENIIEA